MLINFGGKFTDIKKGLVKMLESYKTIRKLIQKLTNKNLNHVNDIESLIREVGGVQKISQRQIRQNAQLQLVSEIQDMLKGYIYKGDVKFRRYDVYSHVLCYLNVLWSKINEFVPKNINICTLTPDCMKWKLFLSQLNETKQTMNLWLKQSFVQTYKVNTNEKNPSVYRFSTHLSKANTPSTAHMSLNQSSRGEILETDVQRSQLKRYSFLKRCQTAKPQLKNTYKKKQYPLNVRSPSCIKPKTDSVPQIQKKVARKAMKKRLFFKPEPQNKFESSIEIIQLKENNIQMSKGQVKVFKQTEADNQPPIISQVVVQQKEAEPFDKKYSTMMFTKHTENNIQRRSSMRKIKHNMCQTQVIKSAFSKQNFTENRDVESEKQNDYNSQRSQQTGQKTKFSSKRGRNLKINSITNEDSLKEPEKIQSPKKDYKKSVYFEMIQESLNLINDDPISIEREEQNLQMISKKSARRNGMISSKQIVSVMEKMQKKQKQEELQRQMEFKKKTIEFNAKLVSQLENGQEQITQVQYENQIAQQPFVKNLTMNDFYRQLARLKTDQIKVSKVALLGGESSFFIKQDLLRQEKSIELQEYIRKLRTKHRSLGQIFQLRAEETNKKVENYMIMQRKYAFEADGEWIKNNMRKNNFEALEEDEVQLVQQQSPFSQSITRIDEI